MLALVASLLGLLSSGPVFVDSVEGNTATVVSGLVTYTVPVSSLNEAREGRWAAFVGGSDVCDYDAEIEAKRATMGADDDGSDIKL